MMATERLPHAPAHEHHSHVEAAPIMATGHGDHDHEEHTHEHSGGCGCGGHEGHSHVEAPIMATGHGDHDHEEHAHEHSAGCGCGGHEGHSHEGQVFSEALEKTWGTRFDTVLQASFLLTTRGAEYASEKRLSMESAIRKLEFSPDPRSQTDAEKQMNQVFDRLIQKSPILQKIKQAPLETIATTLLNLRSVRYTPEDHQLLEEKMVKIDPEEHAHVHTDEKTLTYDVHVGENHHTFTYSQALQIVALHMAQEIQGKGEETPQTKAIHTFAHAFAEAGVTLANKRSLDNPYVKNHPYALREGQTLQDFELALQNNAVEKFQLEDLHAIGGIHGEIRINDQGQLVEDACPDHSEKVDQQLEQLQQETQQEFQQIANEQGSREQQGLRESDDRQFSAGAPAQIEQPSILDTPSQSTTTRLSTPSVSTAASQPQAPTERRPRRTSIPSIPISTQQKQTPSFEDTGSRQPIPLSIVTSQRQDGRQVSQRVASNVVATENVQPIQINSESGIDSNILSFPTLLQADGTTNGAIRVRPVSASVGSTRVAISEPAPIIPFPNNLRREIGGEVPVTSSFQIRYSDASNILVNPSLNQNIVSSDGSSPAVYEEDIPPVVDQAVVETPEEPKPVLPSVSTGTDLENPVVPPISSSSSDTALPSSPRPERPPQNPKKTLDNTQRVTRPVAVVTKAPDIVIGSKVTEALEVAAQQAAVAQREATQEQKEEQVEVAVTQAIGVQKNEQATVEGAEKGESGSGTAPAVSRTNETRQESSETEVTVQTATGNSVRARQSGITAPVSQGRSVNTDRTKATEESEQQATERGTNEEVQKGTATGVPVQITTPHRTQSDTTRTTASVATSQGARLELQVDARYIDQNNPVNTRMLFDQMLKQLAA